MSNLTGPTKEPEILDLEATNRRHFTANSVAGIVSAFLISCGKTVRTRKSGSQDSTSTKKKKSEDETGESIDTSSVGDGDKVKADGGGVEVPGPGTTAVDTTAPVGGALPDGTTLPPVVTTTLSEETLDLSKATKGSVTDLIYKLYGTKSRAMFAFAKKTGVGLTVGDYIYLLQPMGTVGRIIAQRKVCVGNGAAIAQIFDNVCLTGFDTLCVALSSNGAITYYPLDAAAGTFEGSYKAKPVIDPTTIQEIPHPNYGEYMPTMGFGDPAGISSTLSQFGQTRFLVAATPTSTWATPTFETVSASFVAAAPGVTAIELTDAVGRLINTTYAAGTISLPANHLATTSTVVLYTMDSIDPNNVHYHRYFFFIG